MMAPLCANVNLVAPLVVPFRFRGLGSRFGGRADTLQVFGLVSSISATCSLMTGGRFMSIHEMERFLEIG